MADLYQDTYWFPDGTLAAGIEARVFPRHSNVLATIWQDAGETIPAPNPILTDAGGVLTFYATPGDYWIYIGRQSFRIPLDADGVIDDVWYETYEHIQSVPSDTWVIAHDMNANPLVAVTIGGEYIPGVSVTYTDLNNLIIQFSTPQVGTALLRR